MKIISILRQKKGIVIISVLILFLVFQACQNSTEPVINDSSQNTLSKVAASKVTNDDLEAVAKSLALVLANKEYRQILEAEKNATDNREEILDASVFLTAAREEVKDQKSFLSKMKDLITDKDQKEIIQSLKTLDKGNIDIYFPIDEQRESWVSDDENLIVAVLDHDIVNAKSGFLKAFNLTGESLEVDVTEVPKQNTLVVSISETKGNYPKKDLTTASSKILKNIKVSAAVQTTSETEIHTWQLKVRTFFVRDAVGDGIWGDPEYWLAVYHHGGNTTSTNTNFFDCTESGTGYYNLNRTVYYFTATSPYYDNYDDTRFEVWEDDGGLLGQDDLIENYWAESDNGTHQTSWEIPLSTNAITHQIYWGQNDDIWLDMGWIY